MGLFQGGPWLPTAKTPFPVVVWCPGNGHPSREGNQRVGTQIGSVNGLASPCCGRQTELAAANPLPVGTSGTSWQPLSCAGPLKSCILGRQC